MDLENTSIKIKNYKSFGATEQGYEEVKPINLIIGRNNTGKSTLLDLIEYATQPTDLRHLGHRGEKPQVTVTNSLKEETLRMIYRENAGGGHLGGNHWEYGSHWIGKPITWILEPTEQRTFVAVDPEINYLPNQVRTKHLRIKTRTPFLVTSSRNFSQTETSFQRKIKYRKKMLMVTVQPTLYSGF